jgi:hypothetical protein
MTLTLLQREAMKLPKAQRLKLASALLESAPAPGPAPSFEEIERRADEALSGKVKMISASESKARINRLMARIKQDRQTRRIQ